MLDWKWLIETFQWPLTMATIFVGVRWLAKSHLRPRPRSEAMRMVYPTAFLGVGIVGFLLFAGVTAVSNIYPNETVTVWTTSGFSGFALMALLIVFTFYRDRYELSDDGILRTGFAGGNMKVRWSEIRSARYRVAPQWFRLETQTGQVMRVSSSLKGIREFVTLLRQHAPATAIDAATQEIIDDVLAEGAEA